MVKIEKYAVAESPTGTWFYHLREVGKDGLKLSGGSGPALCGATTGWDTLIPVSSFGVNPGPTSRWCPECCNLGRRETTPGEST